MPTRTPGRSGSGVPPLWHAHGMDTDAFKQWWASLDDGRKAEARALSPGENVPAWMVTSLARAGSLWLYWPDVQARPDGRSHRPEPGCCLG